MTTLFSPVCPRSSFAAHRLPARWSLAYVGLASIALGLVGFAVAQPLPEAEETLWRAKVGVFIDAVADVYSPTANASGFANTITDPEKDTWPKVIARFAKYGPLDPNGQGNLVPDPLIPNSTVPNPNKHLVSGNAWIDLARTTNRTNVFHFAFPGMARILCAFPSAPSVETYRTQYLQLVFSRLDNYNAFTGEGTENHINMGRTSAYLYAQEAAKLRDAQGQLLIPAAPARLAQLKAWVLQWAKRVFAMGTGEWQSTVYDVYNLSGWFCLHDFADDPEVRLAARAVLDYYAVTLALRYTHGLMGGPESRGNTGYTAMTSGTDTLAWLWFAPTSTAAPSLSSSSGRPQRDATISVHAATSSYRPPVAAIRLARKLKADGSAWTGTWRGTRPDYLIRQAAEVAEHFHVGPTYTLGTAYLPYGGFTGASSALVNWKLVARAGTPWTTAPHLLWGNDGARSSSNARGRTPYSQFAQSENVLFQLTYQASDAASINSAIQTLVEGAWRTSWNNDFNARWGANQDRGAWSGSPATPVGFSAGTGANGLTSWLYFTPSNAPVSSVGNVRFVELGDTTTPGSPRTYLAIRSLRGATPEAQSASSSQGRFRDVGVAGELAGFVIEVGSSVEYTSMTDFQNRIISQTSLNTSERVSQRAVTYTDTRGRILRAQYITSGSWTEQSFDWVYGVQEQLVVMNDARWRLPDFPSGEGHGRIASLTVNGVAAPLTGGTAVLDGPGLVLSGGQLSLDDGAAPYAVDFRGELPVFSDAVGPLWRGYLLGITTDVRSRAARALLDQNGDGRANLLDYALGADPGDRSGRRDRQPVRGEVMVEGQPYATLSFRLRADAAYTVVAEFSGNLTGWTEGVEVAREQQSDGTVAVTWRDTVVAGASPRLARVRVQLVE